ncbi:2-phosphosulfolactate phosphatase [Candidatus Poribacteria bacterium]|nr:2-phosphosulfolactate phosphatase [Candidatus Poribacteria bacterium]
MLTSIDVVFTPALLPFSAPTGKTAVVTDILRATTTITFAIANGALNVTPVLTPDEAFQLAAKQPNTLIGGERYGKKVEGFDLGNSPREYTPTVVSGKRIVLTTTNGTRTLQACHAAKQVIVGSFLNLQGVLRFLAQVEGELVFVCSGREGGFCMEDTVFAGACVDALQISSTTQSISLQLTDSAVAAQTLYLQHSDNLLGMLRNCYHGRYLASIGLAEDLAFCAQTDRVDIVPLQMDGQIVAPTSVD